MKEIKKELRKKYIEIRNNIDKTERNRMSLKISDKVLNEDCYKTSDLVFIYVSIGSEVETHWLIDKMLEDGKKVAVPRVDKKSHTMEIYEINSFEDLSVGSYGILEPNINLSSVCLVKTEDIDLAVVPGVTFDKDGMRIGYGGGYYDRFLKNYTGISVGLVFPQSLADKLPTEEFDCGVEIVISLEEMI